MSFVTFGEYLSMPRDPEPWIVEDIISTGGVATIYGRGKIGKSWACLGMAIAISQGHPDWLGLPIRQHGHVAYVQLDVGGVLWHGEYCQPIASFFPNPSTFHMVDRDMAPFPFDICGAGGPWLKRKLAELNPRPILVIVDTMRRVHGGDENDSGHMQNVLSAISDACAPSALLLVTHSRKENPNVSEDVLNDVRGSTALTGAVDCVMRLVSRSPREKGLLLYEGRTDLGKKHLRRHPSGLWLLQEEDEAVIAELLTTSPHLSQNALADTIADKLGISHRTAVRRLQEYRERKRH